jgi:hypothetical protein
MSNFKPATVVFSLPGSSSSNKFDKPLDELVKQYGNKPADITPKKQNRLDIKGVVQKNVKENTKSKPARALNAMKSENNPRLNKRAEDKKGRARPVFIVPPKKDEPVNKGAKFNRNNSNTIHSDEKVKIVVKNDQFGKKEKETKKKEIVPKERITIKVNRTEDELMDSDGDRDNESPQRAPRHNEKKRRRSRSRSESDSDEEYKRRRRPYSVNQVQPAPMYAQPQYSMPVMAAPAPVPSVPRMYSAPPPGPHGVFQNILHSILKQNINERLDQTGLPPPPQPTMPVRSYGYSAYPVAPQPQVMEPEPMQPMFADNDRSGGMTLSQRFGSSSSSSKSSSGTSKITVRLH